LALGYLFLLPTVVYLLPARIPPSFLLLRHSLGLALVRQLGSKLPTEFLRSLKLDDARLRSSLPLTVDMEHRSRTVRIPIVRRPLGDATQRVNSATVATMGRQSGVEIANNPLAKQKTHVRGISNPVPTSNPQAPVERPGNRPQLVAAPISAPAHVDPRLSTVTQGSQQAGESRRVPQFSQAPPFKAPGKREPKTIIGPWELGQTLGEGSSARVRLARHRVGQHLVAVKIVAKSTAHLNQAGSLANLDRIDHRRPIVSADGSVRRMPLAIEREVAILKLIQHPNIIELLDIWENRQEM